MIMFQKLDISCRESGVSPNFELLDGEPHITETLGKLKIRISPHDFFQVGEIS